MTDKDMPDHETIEKWVHDQPMDVVKRLPDSIEKRECERLIPIVADLAYRAREKVPYE